MSKNEIVRRIKVNAENLIELLEDNYDINYRERPDELLNELMDLVYAADMFGEIV